MKKILLTCFTLLLVTGCGGGGPKFNDKTLSQWLSELKGSTGAQRRQAVQAVGEIGKLDKSKLPEILAILKGQLTDQDVDARRAAAVALGSLKEDAKSTVPDLLKALSDSDKEVRSNAAQALVQIDGQNKELVSPLAKLLQDKEMDVRKSAVAALGDMGPVAKPAVPQLEEAKGRDENQKDFDFKLLCGEALKKINVSIPPQ
jgi:vesicle coat complex subunit